MKPGQIVSITRMVTITRPQVEWDLLDRAAEFVEMPLANFLSHYAYVVALRFEGDHAGSDDYVDAMVQAAKAREEMALAGAYQDGLAKGYQDAIAQVRRALAILGHWNATSNEMYDHWGFPEELRELCRDASGVRA